EEIEKEAVALTLKITGGKQTAAARPLGILRPTPAKKMPRNNPPTTPTPPAPKNGKERGGGWNRCLIRPRFRPRSQRSSKKPSGPTEPASAKSLAVATRPRCTCCDQPMATSHR